MPSQCPHTQPRWTSPGSAGGLRRCPAVPEEKELAPVPKGMPNNSEVARARAEALFKRREQQSAEAPLAWAEYRQAQEALRERTRKLREQRVGRDQRGGGLNN